MIMGQAQRITYTDETKQYIQSIRPEMETAPPEAIELPSFWNRIPRSCKVMGALAAGIAIMSYTITAFKTEYDPSRAVMRAAGVTSLDDPIPGAWMHNGGKSAEQSVTFSYGNKSYKVSSWTWNTAKNDQANDANDLGNAVKCDVPRIGTSAAVKMITKNLSPEVSRALFEALSDQRPSQLHDVTLIKTGKEKGSYRVAANLELR
jgi:hypothetical protein